MSSRSAKTVSLLWLSPVIGFVCVILSVFLPTSAQAAAGINQQLNFQGRLLNTAGATVSDGIYNIEFKIYQDGDGQSVGDTTGSPAGTLKWTEDHLVSSSTGVIVKNGYLSVQLGSVTAFGSSIDWNQDTLWLSVDIGNTSSCTITTSFDTDCGGDGEMIPMKRLSANPYALNSGELGGLTSSQFVQLAQGLQTDASTNTNSIYINKTGTGGNFIDLQASGADAFTLDNSGNIGFGSNANHTISVAGAGAGLVGKSLTVSAGAAGTGGSALAGGDLVLQGGNGGGTNGNGGNLTLDAGAPNGSGSGGTINIGNTNAAVVNVATNAAAHTIAIGNGAAVQGITIGSTNSTSSLLLQAGTGNLSIQTQGGTLGIGSNAVAQTITIGNTTGATSVTLQSGSGGISLNTATTVAANFTVTGVGNVAFEKGTDYSTTGSANNVSFGTGTVIRLTGASAQTITGIAGGTDGRILTIVNAAGQAATISNLSGSSSATNQISTGTGSDLSLAANSAIYLVYDSGSSLWRVVGSSSSTTGFIQLQSSTPGTQQTGNFNISGTGIAGSFDSVASGTLNLGTSNAATIDIGTNGAAHTIAVGNGAAVQSITIGSTNSTSSLLVQAGTGNLSVQTQGGTLGIANNAVAQTVQIGNTTGSTGITENVGTGNYTLDGVSNSTYTLGASTTTGTITIGGTAQTGTIGIGTGTGAESLNFGTGGTGAKAVTIGSTASTSSLLLQSGTGNLSIQTQGTGTLGIGTNAVAQAIQIGNTTGASSVTLQSGSGGIALNSATTVAASFTVTSAGNVAFQKGTDYSTTGSANNVNLGTGALIRLTGISAQTITGIANGVDGRVLTLVNAAGQAATLSNLSGSSSAANQISTGTGSDLSLPAGGSVSLVYDAGASLWRVVGSVAAAGGYVQLQTTTPGSQQTGNSNISGTTIAGSFDSVASGTLSLGNTNASTVNIATNGSAHTIAIGNGAAVQGITIGSTNSTSSLLLQAGTGNLSIQTQGGTLGIGNNAVAQTIQIGNSTGATAVTVDCGTGTCAFGTTATAHTTNVGSTNGGSTTTLQGGTGGVNVGTGGIANTVQIGNTTGAVAQIIDIGNNATASSTSTVVIGSTVAGNITIQSAATINVGQNAAAQTINIGNTTGATALVERVGTGNYSLDGVGGSTYTLGASTTTGTITIGGTVQTGTLGIGTGTGVESLNFGTGGTGAKTVVIGSTASTSALTLQSGTGNLSIQTQGTGILGIGTNTVAQTIQVGNTTGATSVTLQSGSGGINLNSTTTVAANFAVTSAGNVAFQKGTDYSTTGSANNVNLGTGALIRLTGVSAQTITGITGGADGRILTLVNAAGQAATLSNLSGSSSAANQISTGTGSDLALPAGGSVSLVYDAGASLWRVVGSAAAAGGYVQLQTTTPGSQQTGNFNISGTGIAGSFDSVASGTLSLGTTNAATVNIATNGSTHTIAIGNGAAVQGVTVGSTNSTSSLLLQAGTGNLSIQTQGGTLGIANNAVAQTVQIGNNTGATSVTLQSGSGGISFNGTTSVSGTNTFSTGTGNVTIQGNTTVSANFTFNNGSNVAFQKGSDYSTTGSANNVNFGTGVLIRLTGASAQTVTGITGGVDGRVLTLVNAAGQAATLRNLNASSSAANQISTGTGSDLTLPAGGSVSLVYDAGASLWRVIGNAAATGGYIQLQGSTPGTQQTGNFNISGTGIAGSFDSVASGTLSLGNTNASTIQIGNTSLSSGTQTISIGTNNTSGGTTNITIGAGSSATGGTTALQAKGNITFTTNGVARGTFDTANDFYFGNGVTAATPNNFTIQGTGSTTTAVAGGSIIVQGGNATVGNANGGTITVAGGTGFGTGVVGSVILTTPTFQTAGSQSCGSNCNITQTNIDSNGAVIVNATASSLTVTLSNPTTTTAGKIIYVTAANGSNDFTLSVNGGGTGNLIAMRQNTTATMIWNGSAWTAAGASSSTTLQAAYNNTLTSAGGAELVVSNGTNANGLTIRDSSSNPINGILLEVQNSSAAELFSVSDSVTEYASNGGAESTFGTEWAGVNGATVTRNTNTTYIANGTGSVSIATTTTANSGARNTLSTTLTPNMNYNVSFAARLTLGSAAFTDLNVFYSIDGTTESVACSNYSTQAVNTSIWTKINCTFTAPSSGLTSSNAVFIQQTASGTARTFYIDNFSVTVSGNINYATDGSVDDGVNFSTNWTAVGSSTVVRSTTVGNDTSDSAQVTTTAANQGVRNKLSINPFTSTLYLITVYAASTTSGFNSFTVQYSRDGGTHFTSCVDYNTQTVSSSVTAFTEITCYITTDGTAPTSPYVYFTQTDSTGRIFYVDTFTMALSNNTVPDVQIGGGAYGGPVTLFTLDRAASAPIAANNNALLGSMYYDTTLGKLQCYESDGWGACGSSPDNIITISPEYTNAVLHGTGVGTMTSDICSGALHINDGTSSQPTICASTETYNFYKWTSPQATAQTYSVYVTYQLPSTFKSFSSGQTSLMGRTDSTNATVQYSVYRNDSGTGLTQCGTTVAVSTGSVSSWQTGNATGAADPSTCGFIAGDSIVFKIDVIASQNADAYVGNLGFTFSNK